MQKDAETSMNNQPKLNETSLKNPSKINQKSTKNQSKINQNRSWSPLEPSWRRPSRHGGVQDPFKSEQLNFALTLERNGHSGEKW